MQHLNLPAFELDPFFPMADMATTRHIITMTTTTTAKAMSNFVIFEQPRGLPISQKTLPALLPALKSVPFRRLPLLFAVTVNKSS